MYVLCFTLPLLPSPWADLNLMLPLGCTVIPLKVAIAEWCWVEVQGVQLNAVDGAGNTALMDAIRHSHKEVQASLRAAGANLAAVNVADKLCLAAAEDDTPFLEVHCPTTFAPSPRPTAFTPYLCLPYPMTKPPGPTLRRHPAGPLPIPLLSPICWPPPHPPPNAIPLGPSLNTPSPCPALLPSLTCIPVHQTAYRVCAELCLSMTTLRQLV